MTDFTALLQVSELLLERALRAHRENRRASAVVAANIAQLEALRAHAQTDAETQMAQQRVGADTLFRGWAMQQRLELNRRAAMARAAELDSHARSSLAFGRKEAARALIETDRRKAAQRRMATEEEQIEAIAIMRRYQQDR